MHAMRPMVVDGGSEGREMRPSTISGGGRVMNLNDLTAQFEKNEAMENPDEVVGLNALTMSDRGNIVSPRGEYALNDWSRRQLASILGVLWNRWFENAGIEAQAAEINGRPSIVTGK